MTKDDLQFLLKDKYRIGPSELDKLKQEDPETYSKIASDIKMLEQGYPRDYVIGYVDFLGCKIDLSFKPLIPRTETEYWVGKSLVELSNLKDKKILDIFCGSGCIGIAISKYFPDNHVTFSDNDQTALQQTQLNLEINKVNPEKYSIIESNIFEKIEGTFDYIFANPPYVAQGDEVQESTKHEPQNAIFGGANGLDIIGPFLSDARNFLNPNGKVFMEIGEGQKDEVEKILGMLNMEWIFREDQFGKFRWVVISP